MVFVLDASSSITEQDFQKEKTIVNTVTEYFGLSDATGRSAVVVYGDQATVEIGFHDFIALDQFKEAITNITQYKGSTRIDRALFKTNEVLSPVFQTRESARKLVFVLSDGEQSRASDVIALDIASLPLNSKRAKVFAIGIGSDVNREQLRKIVKRDEDILTAQNFYQLLDYVKLVSEQQCHGKGKEMAVLNGGEGYPH